MVLLSIGMAGLYSMSVVQTRQTARMSEVLPASETPSLNRSPDAWARKLGVYANIDNITTPMDPIFPYTYVEQIVDNLAGSPLTDSYQSPSDSYGWTSWTNSESYLGNAHYHRSDGNVGSYFEFQLSGLTPGEYEVYTTYRALGTLGDAVTHQVYDGLVLLASVDVNQQQACDDLDHNGRMWDRLGIFPINSGTVKVRLADGPGSTSYMLADAVLIRSVRSLELLSVSDTAGGGATATLEAP